MLQIDSYKKAYGSTTVLDIPSLQLQKGIYWLRGENGAGKTTFMKSVSALIPFEGGKALFDLANGRTVPIPVFAEMGSVNPVFLLPQKLREEKKTIAGNYVKSITQSAGQFCTNPGILVGIDDEALTGFRQLVAEGIRLVMPAKMLHPGIAKNFLTKRKVAIEEGVTVIATNDSDVNEDESIPTFAEVSAELFLNNPLFHKEIFAPYSL